ncbi:MAG: flavin reductase family protein [Flavobacteriales bacterium]|nr:flavin reductase family protein [Flavobacteriales bacterium]
MLEIIPSEVTVPKLHGLLLGVVGPRPIALASTVDASGNQNLSPFSFFNIFSANPPIAIFSPARRGRDNTVKHTYENVLEVPEVVINIVNHSIVEQVSLSSTEYPKGVNEFEKSGLTPISSHLVRPSRVAESPAQLECHVNQVIALGNGGGAGNLVVCEILKMHISEDILDADGRVDMQKIDLVGRMGGDWYVRASGSALFEVEKPLTKLGIGVDALPRDIRDSKVLTGNHIGKLGNVEALPDETAVNEYKLIELSELFVRWADTPVLLEQKLHQHAAQLLDNNRVADAWKTLLSFNNR